MTSDLPPEAGSPADPIPPVAGTAPPASTPPPSSAPPPEPPRNGPTGTDDFFGRVRMSGLVRPDDGRWVAGVAQAISRRWNVDPILVRGIFVALSLFGGLGVLAYGVGWLLIPQTDGRIHLQQAIRGDFTAGFVGASLVTLLGIGGATSTGPWNHGWGFPGPLIVALLIVGGIWWLARNGRSGRGRGDTPPPVPGPPGAAPGSGESSAWSPSTWPTSTGPTTGSSGSASSGSASYGSAPTASASTGVVTEPVYGTAAADPYATPTTARWAGVDDPVAAADRRTSDEVTRRSRVKRELSRPSRLIQRLTLGAALLVAAVIALAGRAADWDAPAPLLAVAAALGVVAVGIVVSGLSGRRSAGLAVVGVVLAVVTMLGAGAYEVGVRSGQNVQLAGSSTWQPTSAADVDRQFNLGVGEALIDVTSPAIAGKTTTGDPIRVRVGAGRLTVVVPYLTPTLIELRMGAGDVTLPDGTIRRVGREDQQTRERPLQIRTGPSRDGLQPEIVLDIRQGAGEVFVRYDDSTTSTVPPATSASVAAAPSAPTGA